MHLRGFVTLTSGLLSDWLMFFGKWFCLCRQQRVHFGVCVFMS